MSFCLQKPVKLQIATATPTLAPAPAPNRARKAIKEARLWPEAITEDATYKTNAHKLSLVNIVGTDITHLQTFAIAAAFVNDETDQTYMWITEELREDVWSTEANFLITEELVFPLVYMHLRNVERPIVLLLTCNHIYYVEFKRTLTGRLKIFIKPILNIGHE
ncbi:hypothetical protein MFLAVUS_008798 [Mucor flavus]|uniref:MULE transposase domain-containing protein n=1 Tax=Mucor flavus TaxID=439312 RepID=A0ABP9Z8A1_9FUNG